MLKNTLKNWKNKNTKHIGRLLVALEHSKYQNGVHFIHLKVNIGFYFDIHLVSTMQLYISGITLVLVITIFFECHLFCYIM